MTVLTDSEIWEILEGVKDPEIPVVSVVEMGIVREVTHEGDHIRVVMTPTFSGCPAIEMMRAEIEAQLRQAGAQQVEVVLSRSPAWSSEWITPEARSKLRAFGLGPPPHHKGNLVLALQEVVSCPYCGSQEVTLKNSFGPTLCRMIYYCNHCNQPFEQFKPV